MTYERRGAKDSKPSTSDPKATAKIGASSLIQAYEGSIKAPAGKVGSSTLTGALDGTAGDGGGDDRNHLGVRCDKVSPPTALGCGTLRARADRREEWHDWSGADNVFSSSAPEFNCG